MRILINVFSDPVGSNSKLETSHTGRQITNSHPHSLGHEIRTRMFKLHLIKKTKNFTPFKIILSYLKLKLTKKSR
jgi:hypothetical protein